MHKYDYYYNKLDNRIMGTEFNANVKLLMGGRFRGNSSWNKEASEIDNCFKIYRVHSGRAVLYGRKDTDLPTDCDGGEEGFVLEGGRLYFINGFAIHAQECQENFEVEWIHFQPESVYFNHILKHSPCTMKLKGHDLDLLQGVTGKFEPFFRNELAPRSHRVVQLEILAFIHFVISRIFGLLDRELFEGQENLNRLKPALEFITANYNNPLDLGQIADKCCLSPNYFHRMFSSVFGMSPLYYIRKMRMQEAIRQLVYTERPVKEIAFETGYEDEAYFSRTFSKVYGISPGRYRKQYRQRSAGP